jgi:hypothetical protein
MGKNKRLVIEEMKKLTDDNSSKHYFNTAVKTMMEELSRTMHGIEDKRDNLTKKLNELIIPVCSSYPDKIKQKKIDIENDKLSQKKIEGFQEELKKAQQVNNASKIGDITVNFY